MRQWISALFSRRHTPRPSQKQHRQTVRGHLEELEGRLLLHGDGLAGLGEGAAAAHAAVLRQDRLVVQGDSRSNVIEIALDATGDMLEVTIDDDAPRMFDVNAVRELVIRGGRGNDDITIDSDVDVAARIEGGRGNDEIEAGGGAAHITGGRASDMLTGGDGDDTMHGGMGNDSLMGEGGDDRMWGGPHHSHEHDGNDMLRGGDGDDRLSGGYGRDDMDGEDGADTLRGGRGRDMFASNDSEDVRRDFHAGRDREAPGVGNGGNDGGNDGGNNGGDNGGNDGGNDGGNQGGVNGGRFGSVTPGPFDNHSLLGARTDNRPGAPPITAQHLGGNIDYVALGFPAGEPPTYGPHHPFDPGGSDSDPGRTPRRTGVYITEQPDEDLVHNLEHGHVWISYNPDLLSASDQETLQELVDDGGTDTGVILTPRHANTSAIALASWAHLQTLNSFDAAAIRAFIVTNRGHGPEGFIPGGERATADEFPRFRSVTTGSFTDPNILGIRTDLVPGAPPITAPHVNGDVDYAAFGFSNPPSYGPHHPFDPNGVDGNPGATPRPTGVHTTQQPDEDLVHNLEHGHVWISYNPNLLSAFDRAALEELVDRGGGRGNGVILEPRAENDAAIALVSWARLLKLDRLDADAINTIRAFVDTNRGHSPEGFITP